MKKALKKIANVFRYVSLGIVLLFIFVALYLGVIVRDIKPFDDSDMKIVIKNVPDDQNAYPLLWMAQMPQMPENRPAAIFLKLKNIDWKMKREKPLSNQTFNEALFYYKERIATVDRAAKMKYSQGPLPVTWDDERVLNYSSFRDIAILRLNLAEHEFSDKQTDELLLTGIDMAKFGKLVEQNEGGTTIFHSLDAGKIIKRTSLLKVNKYLDAGYFTENPKKAIDALGEIYESNSSLINAWKSEYHRVSYELNQYDLYKMDPKGPLWKGYALSYNPISRYMLTLLIKTERSRKAMYDVSKSAIKQIEKARFCSELDRSNVQVRILLWNRPFTLKAMGLIWRGEYGPKFFQEMFGPTLFIDLEDKFYLDSLTDFTRIRIAAMAYHKDHGELPPTLGALVPEYIDKIPFDRFDGKQIRYNRSRKIIYSAGLNGLDDGGKYDYPLVSNKWKKQKDLALQIMR